MLLRQLDAIPPTRVWRGQVNRLKRFSLAECILHVDSWLRGRQGVFEYSDKRDCLFRAQVARLHTQVILSDGTFGRPCDKVVHLHLWNEQVPKIPKEGPSLAWGRQFSRRFEVFLRDLALFLINDPQVANIAIICANMSIGSKGQNDALQRITARHGFEAIPDPAGPLYSQYARWFGEDILYWLLTIACNPSAVRLNKFWRSRTPIYLSRKVLERNQHSANSRNRRNFPASNGAHARQ